MRHLGELVDENPNSIITIGGWETRSFIHEDNFPSCMRNVVGEKRRLSTMKPFAGNTDTALVNPLLDLSLHVGPPITALNFHQRACQPPVTRCRETMSNRKYLPANVHA